MSTPFKMKGWSGSPIRQNPKSSLADIQQRISNTFKSVGDKIRKHVKPQSESSGFGLTNAEKAQAKKLGISEYQWKTGTGVSGTTRHKKRMWEKKKKTTISDEDFKVYLEKNYPEGIVTAPSGTPMVPGGSEEESTPTEVDYGTGMTTKDWKQKSSTGWSLHELTQERKKFDVGSPEYENIRKAINLGYKTGGPVEESDPVVEEKKEEAIPEGYAQYGVYPDTKKNREDGIAGEPIIMKLKPGDRGMPHTTHGAGGPKKGHFYKVGKDRKVMMWNGNNYVAEEDLTYNY